MCVIIVKPEAEHLTKDAFRALWTQNPDGGGFSVVDNGTLIVHKSMDRNELWRKWRSYQERLGNPEMVMHLRIATHGSIGIDNCHPFAMVGNDNAVFYHNGILSCSIPPKDDNRSDTRYFVEEQLSRLPSEWWTIDSLFDLIESASSGNRLLIHALDGIWRFNTHLWTKRDGLILSNDRGLPKVIVAKPNPTLKGLPMTKDAVWLPDSFEDAELVAWESWPNDKAKDDSSDLVEWWAEQNAREIQTLIGEGDFDALDDLLDRDLGVTADDETWERIESTVYFGRKSKAWSE